MSINKFFMLSIVLLASCNQHPVKEQSQTKKDSIITKEVESDDQELEEPEYELNYVVSIAEGYNYDSLKEIAIETSKFLGFKFDTLDRYYNRDRKKIVLPDDYEDDVWAGDYYFRRFGNSLVSIEMRDAYIDIYTNKDEKAKEKFYSDSLRMFVFATMYTEKGRADSLLRVLKPNFKDASIIPTEIYMGCMH